MAANLSIPRQLPFRDDIAARMRRKGFLSVALPAVIGMVLAGVSHIARGNAPTGSAVVTPATPPPDKRRRWFRRLAWLALAAVAFLIACNLTVLAASAGRVTPVGCAAEAPARRAAVVMGCIPKLRNGQDNLYFMARIEAAAELWRAGKVEALIVSGDNHVKWYDEPSEMKKSLVAAGVPEERIVCDYAGFRTLDSIVRAKTVFGLDSFLVVSQDFHIRRAIFLARCHGLDVHGYAARGVRLRRLSFRTIVREPLARVAAVLDILFGRRPHFDGPPVLLPGAEGLTDASILGSSTNGLSHLEVLYPVSPIEQATDSP